MEDEDIAPEGSQLIQSAGAESHGSSTLFQDRNIVVLARLSAHTHWSCTYVFGAISSRREAKLPRELTFFSFFQVSNFVLTSTFPAQIAYTNWNHLDFLWGIDADTLVYKYVLDNMAKCRDNDCRAI